MSVFIIVNEFAPEGGNPSMEIVGTNVPKYWMSQNAAWEELREMAAGHDIHLGPDDLQFDARVGGGIHLEYDEYSIMELEEAE